MGLLTCLDCKKTFSDRIDNCPFCGCPKEEILKAIGQEELSEEKKIKQMQKRKSKPIKLIVVGIFLLLIIVSAVLFWWFPQCEYKKALEYIEKNQYIEARDMLEKSGTSRALQTMKNIENQVQQESIIEAKIGDIVTLGEYEQDNDLNNGKEKIEWIVIAKENEKTLLISRYALNSHPYLDTDDNATWEESVIRQWLIRVFMKEAFVNGEVDIIQTVELVNKDNSKYGTEGGNNTTDQLFLLSEEEVNEYLQDESIRTCEPTEYAFSSQETIISGKNGKTDWWLRTPGKYKSTVMLVEAEGSFSDEQWSGNSRNAVRPAMWIKHDF